MWVFICIILLVGVDMYLRLLDIPQVIKILLFLKITILFLLHSSYYINHIAVFWVYWLLFSAVSNLLLFLCSEISTSDIIFLSLAVPFSFLHDSSLLYIYIFFDILEHIEHVYNKCFNVLICLYHYVISGSISIDWFFSWTPVIFQFFDLVLRKMTHIMNVTLLALLSLYWALF